MKIRDSTLNSQQLKRIDEYECNSCNSTLKDSSNSYFNPIIICQLIDEYLKIKFQDNDEIFQQFSNDLVERKRFFENYFQKKSIKFLIEKTKQTSQEIIQKLFQNFENSSNNFIDNLFNLFKINENLQQLFETHKIKLPKEESEILKSGGFIETLTEEQAQAFLKFFLIGDYYQGDQDAPSCVTNIKNLQQDETCYQIQTQNIDAGNNNYQMNESEKKMLEEKRVYQDQKELNKIKKHFIEYTNLIELLEQNCPGQSFLSKEYYKLLQFEHQLEKYNQDAKFQRKEINDEERSMFEIIKKKIEQSKIFFQDFCLASILQNFGESINSYKHFFLDQSHSSLQSEDLKTMLIFAFEKIIKQDFEINIYTNENCYFQPLQMAFKEQDPLNRYPLRKKSTQEICLLLLNQDESQSYSQKIKRLEHNFQDNYFDIQDIKARRQSLYLVLLQDSQCTINKCIDKILYFPTNKSQLHLLNKYSSQNPKTDQVFQLRLQKIRNQSSRFQDENGKYHYFKLKFQNQKAQKALFIHSQILQTQKVNAESLKKLYNFQIIEQKNDVAKEEQEDQKIMNQDGQKNSSSKLSTNISNINLENGNFEPQNSKRQFQKNDLFQLFKAQSVNLIFKNHSYKISIQVENKYIHEIQWIYDHKKLLEMPEQQNKIGKILTLLDVICALHRHNFFHGNINLDNLSSQGNLIELRNIFFMSGSDDLNTPQYKVKYISREIQSRFSIEECEEIGIVSKMQLMLEDKKQFLKTLRDTYNQLKEISSNQYFFLVNFLFLFRDQQKTLFEIRNELYQDQLNPLCNLQIIKSNCKKSFRINGETICEIIDQTEEINADFDEGQKSNLYVQLKEQNQKQNIFNDYGNNSQNLKHVLINCKDYHQSQIQNLKRIFSNLIDATKKLLANPYHIRSKQYDLQNILFANLIEIQNYQERNKKIKTLNQILEFTQPNLTDVSLNQFNLQINRVYEEKLTLFQYVDEGLPNAESYYQCPNQCRVKIIHIENGPDENDNKGNQEILSYLKSIHSQLNWGLQDFVLFQVPDNNQTFCLNLNASVINYLHKICRKYQTILVFNYQTVQNDPDLFYQQLIFLKNILTSDSIIVLEFSPPKNDILLKTSLQESLQQYQKLTNYRSEIKTLLTFNQCLLNTNQSIFTQDQVVTKIFRSNKSQEQQQFQNKDSNIIKMTYTEVQKDQQAAIVKDFQDNAKLSSIVIPDENVKNQPSLNNCNQTSINYMNDDLGESECREIDEVKSLVSQNGDELLTKSVESLYQLSDGQNDLEFNFNQQYAHNQIDVQQHDQFQQKKLQGFQEDNIKISSRDDVIDIQQNFVDDSNQLQGSLNSHNDSLLESIKEEQKQEIALVLEIEQPKSYYDIDHIDQWSQNYSSEVAILLGDEQFEINLQKYLNEKPQLLQIVKIILMKIDGQYGLYYDGIFIKFKQVEQTHTLVQDEIYVHSQILRIFNRSPSNQIAFLQLINKEQQSSNQINQDDLKSQYNNNNLDIQLSSQQNEIKILNLWCIENYRAVKEHGAAFLGIVREKIRTQLRNVSQSLSQMQSPTSLEAILNLEKYLDLLEEYVSYALRAENLEIINHENNLAWLSKIRDENLEILKSSLINQKGHLFLFCHQQPIGDLLVYIKARWMDIIQKIVNYKPTFSRTFDELKEHIKELKIIITSIIDNQKPIYYQSLQMTKSRAKSEDAIYDEQYIKVDAYGGQQIYTENQFQILKLLDLLFLNPKQKEYRMTRLKPHIHSSLQTVTREYMSKMKQYVADVLFEGDQKKLQRFEISWASQSESLVVALTIALSNKTPSIKIYGDAPAKEQGRLESVGAALIEKLFVVCTICVDDNWILSYNDIENKRVQLLKPSHLAECANWGLKRFMILNDEKSDNKPREMHAVLYSIAGALGLYAGIEPVQHLLQQLRLIPMKPQKVDIPPQPTPQPEIQTPDLPIVGQQNQQIKITDDVQVSEKSKIFQSEGDYEEIIEEVQEVDERIQPNHSFQYYWASEYSKEIQDKISLEKIEGSFDEQAIQQIKKLYQVDEKLNSNQQSNDVHNQNNKDQESDQQKGVQNNFDDKITEDTQNYETIKKIIDFLPFVDQSFMDGEEKSFISSNFHNMKLQMIGATVLKLMYKVQLYFFTMNDNIDWCKQNRSADSMEEFILYINAAPYLCHGVYNYFSQIQQNVVPLIASEAHNQSLKPRIENYYQVDLESKSTQSSIFGSVSGSAQSAGNTNTSANSQQSVIANESTSKSNASTAASSQDQNINKSANSGSSSQIDFIKQNFTQYHEKFLPEYALVTLALIGSTYISNQCNQVKTAAIINKLLTTENLKHFPSDSERIKLNLQIWNVKLFSLPLRLSFSIEFSDDSIYYKGFIQQLEVRKLKFKKFHEGKCQKFHADLKAYISLGNKLFEEFHFGQQLTPYNYLVFHQNFRKIYKINIPYEKAKSEYMAKYVDTITSSATTQGQTPIQNPIKTQEGMEINSQNNVIEGKKGEGDPAPQGDSKQNNEQQHQELPDKQNKEMHQVASPVQDEPQSKPIYNDQAS